jgi:hypothetical protein
MSYKVCNASHETFRDYYAPGTMFRTDAADPTCKFGNNSFQLCIVGTDDKMCPLFNLMCVPEFNRLLGVPFSGTKGEIACITHTQLINALRGKSSDAMAIEVNLRIVDYVSPAEYYRRLQRVRDINPIDATNTNPIQ